MRKFFSLTLSTLLAVGVVFGAEEDERSRPSGIVNPAVSGPAGTASGWLQLKSPSDTRDYFGIDYYGGGLYWGVGYNSSNPRNPVAWRSVDNGASWSSIAIGSTQRGILAARDDSVAVYADVSGEIFRTTDAGATWTSVYTYAGGWFDGVAFAGPDTVIAYGDFVDATGLWVVRSTDAGATWTRLTNLPAAATSDWYALFTYHQAMEVYGRTVWLTVYPASSIRPANPRIFKSTDAGDSWTDIEVPLTGGPSENYYIRSINFMDDSLGFLVDRRSSSAEWYWMHKSTDGGVTWSDTIRIEPGAIKDVQDLYGVVPIRGTDNVVACGEDFLAGPLGKTWWSTDRGTTWAVLPATGGGVVNSAFATATEGFAVGFDNQLQYTPKELVNVTFTCNTATVPDTIPVAGSNVQIRGGAQGGGFSPITWGNDSQNNMMNVGGDYWSKTLQMQVGDTLRYKYVIAYLSGTGWEQNTVPADTPAVSGGDRSYIVAAKDTTLEVEFWNNGPGDRPQYFRPWVPAPDSMMTVYFRVNMRGPMSSGSFSYDNTNDTVGVRGGGPAGGDLNWSPTYYLLRENSASNGDGYTIPANSMWSGGLQLPKSGVTEGEEISYKFLIGYDWGRDELQGQPNRTFNVPMGMKDTTLQWVFFNNERPSERENPDTIAIQFRANLAAAISSGGFAIGDTIEVRTGYFGTASVPGQAKMMQRVAGTTYLVTDTIITKKDDLLDYQYYLERGRTDQRENYFNFFYQGEVQAEAERRQVMVPTSASLSSPMIVSDTATSIIDPRRQPEFPNARPLARDVKVTYEVDIRPVFYQVLQGDTLGDIQGNIDIHAGVVDSILMWGVWMNGLAVGDWSNPGGGDWGLGLRLNDNKKLWDDGTNGDVSGGDTTFSRIVMVGPDSTQGTQGRVGQVFKFGIYGGDNEGGSGGFGNNHLENVVDTDTTYTLNSQFGSINPAFYDAWDYDLRQPVWPTSVIDPNQPLVYQLAQNYPNPFNPATKIRYSIPTQSYVVLKVYNALGQEVMTLVDGAQKPGIHSAQFDARNLASGVYFYRITAGDFVNVKKMMLLK
jgi:hypothetical protein